MSGFAAEAEGIRRKHHQAGVRVNLRRAVIVLAAASVCTGAQLEAQATMGPRELHDRIVAVYAARSAAPLPVGDTLVSWYGNPVLLHTVRRTSDEITTGMLRADSLYGSSRVRWVADRPTSFEVRWLQADSVLLDIAGSLVGDTLRLSGTTNLALGVPELPWAVADYGMEDQLLPLLDMAGVAEPLRIAAYRPFAAKWDTLVVTRQPLTGGVLYELRSSDGKRDWWLVSQEGALVQLRREGQALERRPLETTPLFAVYRYLREQLPE